MSAIEIADFYAMGRQLPAGTGRDSSILGEQTETGSKRKAGKRGPYKKVKKQAKKRRTCYKQDTEKLY